MLVRTHVRERARVRHTAIYTHVRGEAHHRLRVVYDERRAAGRARAQITRIWMIEPGPGRKEVVARC